MQAHAFGLEYALWLNRLKQEHAILTEALDGLYRQGQAGAGLELTLLLENPKQANWFKHTQETCHAYISLIPGRCIYQPAVPR